MDDTLRHRRQPIHQNQFSNGSVTNRSREERPEFLPRESPLTILFDKSLHIKAIYHIFVVILLVLLCDTVVYDLVESGKVNIGLSTVRHGFGDTRRGAKLWLFEFAMALALYPGMKIYAAGAKVFRRVPGLKQVWTGAGISGVVALLAAMVGMVVWDLGKEHLALGSSVTVTCEMCRLFMKMCAVASVCAPRCHGIGPPLPTFTHYLYFLFAPTLVFRDEYPRTKKVRWGVVFMHFAEVAAIIFYNGFLWERFILPYWSDYGKQPKVEAGIVVRNMFACILPGLISFLCGFYCLLHAWLNAFAEMLTFADRGFYEEWWTSAQFSRYYRAWNLVVHSWLRDHIYRPLAPRCGRISAALAVFVVSALAHELILSLSFGYFYPVLLVEFGVIGVLLVPFTATLGRRFPAPFNMLMWLGFFIGNGLLWSLYPMEFFARKNCPPSEDDSYFYPKSWSCPEIVMKPNWAFQQPF